MAFHKVDGLVREVVTRGLQELPELRERDQTKLHKKFIMTEEGKWVGWQGTGEFARIDERRYRSNGFESGSTWFPAFSR
jgi:hypothetical protein